MKITRKKFQTMNWKMIMSIFKHFKKIEETTSRDQKQINEKKSQLNKWKNRLRIAKQSQNWKWKTQWAK